MSSSGSVSDGTITQSSPCFQSAGVATEYHNLVDEAENRVHARVTVSRAIDAAGESAIARELSRALGKTVVPHVTVDPSILGGVVVKVGDTVMDGSVRRRLAVLRRRLLPGLR